MLNKVLPLLFLFFFSTHRVKAQTGTISVGPLLSCGITTFNCPGVSGCCTIGGCCGGGCCENGYTCINEGTSAEACCPASDPTKCGTAAAPSSSPSGGHTCTNVEACAAVTEDGVGWTCVLGRTCGFSYGECNPCPYIAGSGSGPSTVSYAGSSPSTTSYSGSSPSSVSSPGTSPSPSSGSTTSLGYSSRGSGVGLRWLAAVSLGGVIAIAVLYT
ncbi:uncharacterized protein K444DRAFT_390126 [Hyaloscypha bicolor E]|uniref:GPI anchored protein n=1 Tax=Hyaloscypha bicolor E TaxID=1095630 RepID=A0A2J6TBF4_9HELO|nr:uncharacterized protein K444DRAFT_390126 [Hyaloscypha bicolor E]PMD60302.1 hypothetical protein K444DRAFT_390126 [Hyaloscypha bicolor E]